MNRDREFDALVDAVLQLLSHWESGNDFPLYGDSWKVSELRAALKLAKELR